MRIFICFQSSQPICVHLCYFEYDTDTVIYLLQLQAYCNSELSNYLFYFVDLNGIHFYFTYQILNDMLIKRMKIDFKLV